MTCVCRSESNSEDRKFWKPGEVWKQLWRTPETMIHLYWNNIGMSFRNWTAFLVSTAHIEKGTLCRCDCTLLSGNDESDAISDKSYVDPIPNPALSRVTDMFNLCNRCVTSQGSHWPIYANKTYLFLAMQFECSYI